MIPGNKVWIVETYEADGVIGVCATYDIAVEMIKQSFHQRWGIKWEDMAHGGRIKQCKTGIWHYYDITPIDFYEGDLPTG
jgi:hypothetical protein